MKQNALIRILTAAAILFFAACGFETDGKFAGVVAGAKGNRLRSPSGVQVAADSSGGIQVSWDGPADADGYTVYRSTAADTSRFVRRGSSGGTIYSDSGASVPPDTPFYYQVMAYNAKGQSAPSKPAGPVSARRNAAVLAEPEITSAIANNGDITVSWTAVPGAGGYILYRSSALDSEMYIFRIETGSLSFTDYGLAPGLYSYQVRGFNNDGDGYLSLPWGPVDSEASGGGLPAPAAPQNIRAAQDRLSEELRVNITWNAVSGADRYYVYRSADDELYEEIGQTASSAYQDAAGSGNSLQGGGAYYYRVRGYSGQQPGYLSESCGPVLTLPGKAAIATAVANNTVTVSWPAVNGADLYYVYRSADGSQFQLLTARGISGLSYNDEGLSVGAYYYRVEAANSAGRGPASETEQAVVTLETVTVHAATPVISDHPIGGVYSQGDTATALSVQASASDGGVLSYQWHSNTVNSNTGGTLVSSASAYTPSTSTVGTLYYYAVVTNTNNSVNGNKTATAVSDVAAVTVTGGMSYAIPDGGAIIYISTQAALESIRDHIDDPAYNYGRNAYVLEQDITLSGTWEPIGRVETVNIYGGNPGGIHAFSGNFYGNGHTIRNLVLPGGSTHYIGLFGYIEDALIQDLQVELGTTTITVTNSTGQLIGIIAGIHKNSVIRNCGVYSSSVLVINGASGRSVEFGGISCGAKEGNVSSIIENCYVSMNITATYGGTHLCIGGISFSGIGTIKNCYYIGNIKGNGVFTDLHGIDSYDGSGTIQGSYSAGTIINNATSPGGSSGIGRSDISNCATLMEQINMAIGSSYVKRISSTTFANNYAYSGMLLNGATVTSSDPNSQNGLDKTAAQLKQRSTYEDGLGWDFDTVWEMGPSSYPFPILKWQNGVVKLPPGFRVIGEDIDPFTSISAIESYLAEHTVGGDDPANPVPLPIAMELTNTNWNAILAAIATADKYVNLDLSACPRSSNTSGGGLWQDGTFDPGYAITTGKGKIAAITLPDTAVGIAELVTVIDEQSVFRSFAELRSVSALNVTTIPGGTFRGLSNLTTANFPNVTTIANAITTPVWTGAFQDCNRITDLYIPKVSSIGSNAFRGLDNNNSAAPVFPTLFTITMGNTAPALGSTIFRDCTTHLINVTVRVPAGATGYDTAWQNSFKGTYSINLMIETY